MTRIDNSTDTVTFDDVDYEFPRPSLKEQQSQKQLETDERLLHRERWQFRPGHFFTYIGIFCFTLTLYFRPYELIPALSGFTSMALIIGIVTLLIYLPSQLAAEGSLTALPLEVKCVLFLGAWALLTMPLAKDPSLAWDKFSDLFLKVVIIFVILVNALRTRARLKGLMWLAIAIGVMLSCDAINMYRQGIYEVEGYRVKADVSGMFGNPNDLAIHLVIFTPIAIALALASKKISARLMYYAAAALMVGGIIVTQSRGGFLGLLVAALVLAWKVGRKRRLKVVLISIFAASAVIAMAPGTFGTRILSIVDPSLDPVSSAESRRELLIRSVIVTLRNPLGIGFGNFEIVGGHNQETHNAYTQVSAELGWFALAAYLMLLIAPLRKLAAIERLTDDSDDEAWINRMSIGVYAGIVGYMVSSFFGPVAYNWFIYYPIAYAVCLRRLFQQAEQPKQLVGSSEVALDGDDEQPISLAY